MFKTILEFMDGQTKEIATRHISRTDKDAGVFRLLFEQDEITYPLCNIRSIRTEIIPDQSVEGQNQSLVIDAEKEQKKEEGWRFNLPFFKGDKS